MTLSAILDDIQEDVQPLESVSQENIVVVVNPQPNVKVTTSIINQQTIDKFNTLYHKLVKKDLLGKLDKLEVRVAHEIFTTLPDVSKADYAKLTSAPSTINKTIVQKALNDAQDVAPEDAVQMLTEVRRELEDSFTHVKEVSQGLSVYADFFQQKDKHFTENPPVVISDRQSRNLYISQLGDVAYIDDTALDYDKYSGVLSKKFETLMKEESLNEFLGFFDENHQGHNSFAKSLEELVRCVLDTNSFFQHGAMQKLEHFFKELTAYLESETKSVTGSGYDLVNSAQTHVRTISMVNMIHSVIHRENNFMEQMKALLEFME